MKIHHTSASSLSICRFSVRCTRDVVDGLAAFAISVLVNPVAGLALLATFSLELLSSVVSDAFSSPADEVLFTRSSSPALVSLFFVCTCFERLIDEQNYQHIVGSGDIIAFDALVRLRQSGMAMVTGQVSSRGRKNLH
jgi:hypothetical protein